MRGKLQGFFLPRLSLLGYFVVYFFIIIINSAAGSVLMSIQKMNPCHHMEDLPPAKRIARQWRMTKKKQFEEADKVATPCTERVNIFDKVWHKPQGNLRSSYRAT